MAEILGCSIASQRSVAVALQLSCSVVLTLFVSYGLGWNIYMLTVAR